MPVPQMTMAQGITLICTIVGLGAGAIVWVIAAMLKPMQIMAKADREKFEILIANNTKAMEGIKEMVSDHKCKLEDHADALAEHHTRISVIEAKHEGKK